MHIDFFLPQIVQKLDRQNKLGYFTSCRPQYKFTGLA